MKHIWVTWCCLVALCLSMIVPEDWQRLAFGVSLACMGPLAVACDLLTKKPPTQWQHHAVVLLRVLAFLVVGGVLHWNPSATRDPLFFWLIAVATQILIAAFLPKKSDLVDNTPLRPGMAYTVPTALVLNTLFIQSWWRLDPATSTQENTKTNLLAALWSFLSSAHLSLEMAIWVALVYGVWKSLLWYNLSVFPFSLEQHSSYWSRLLQRSGPSRLWTDVRDYLNVPDPRCSSAMLDNMVAKFPLDALHAYFVNQPKSRHEDVQAAYDRLTQAVQKRIAELDPRTVPVFALYGDDWPTLVHMFKHLDDPPEQSYALPL